MATAWLVALLDGCAAADAVVEGAVMTVLGAGTAVSTESLSFKFMAAMAISATPGIKIRFFLNHGRLGLLEARGWGVGS